MSNAHRPRRVAGYGPISYTPEAIERIGALVDYPGSGKRITEKATAYATSKPARLRPAVAILFSCLTLLAPQPVFADDGCLSGTTRLGTGSTFNLRIDNDVFGGLDQDQDYSNGFLVSWTSPNLVDYVDDPCLPRSVRRLNRYLSWLNPSGFDEQSMTIGFGQMMYTPIDKESRDLIAGDRPYSGALMPGLGYHASKGDRLRISRVRLGMVGPSARAADPESVARSPRRGSFQRLAAPAPRRARAADHPRTPQTPGQGSRWE